MSIYVNNKPMTAGQATAVALEKNGMLPKALDVILDAVCEGRTSVALPDNPNDDVLGLLLSLGYEVRLDNPVVVGWPLTRK